MDFFCLLYDRRGLGFRLSVSFNSCIEQNFFSEEFVFFNYLIRRSIYCVRFLDNRNLEIHKLYLNSRDLERNYTVTSERVNFEFTLNEELIQKAVKSSNGKISFVFFEIFLHGKLRNTKFAQIANPQVLLTTERSILLETIYPKNFNYRIYSYPQYMNFKVNYNQPTLVQIPDQLLVGGSFIFIEIAVRSLNINYSFIQHYRHESSLVIQIPPIKDICGMIFKPLVDFLVHVVVTYFNKYNIHQTKEYTLLCQGSLSQFRSISNAHPVLHIVSGDLAIVKDLENQPHL